MEEATLVGIDLGKHTFHLHGQDRHGQAVCRKQVGRKQLVEFFAMLHACTVVMGVVLFVHFLTVSQQSLYLQGSLACRQLSAAHR